MFPATTSRRFRFALIAALLLPAGSLAAQGDASVRVIPVRTSVGLDAGFAAFDDETNPWTLGAVSLQRRGPAGTLIGRVTVARRFAITGAQYEADAYPRVSSSVYGYLNAGWSSAAIFPEWRVGGELFTTLPGAYEASLGVRHLRFTDVPVTLLTGSVGKYAGNYWLSLRPWLRVRDAGTAASAQLTLRRYGETADDYLGARAGYGATTDDRLVATDVLRKGSLMAGVHGSRRFGARLVGTGALDLEHEQLDALRSRGRLEVNAGVRVDF